MFTCPIHGECDSDFCYSCEQLREEAQIEYERANPYDGDDLRAWEDEQVFRDECLERETDRMED